MACGRQGPFSGKRHRKRGDACISGGSERHYNAVKQLACGVGQNDGPPAFVEELESGEADVVPVAPVGEHLQLQHLVRRGAMSRRE